METKEFTATAGGGAVSNGIWNEKVLKVKVWMREAVDPDDVEMLEGSDRCGGE